jgi:hypothetical protein
MLVPSTFLAELFPTRLRYSGLSLTYGLASGLFGGTAPALATFLVRRTGAALSPACTPPVWRWSPSPASSWPRRPLVAPWTRAVIERPNHAATETREIG